MSLGLDKSAWERVAFGDVVRNINDTVRDPEEAGIDRIIAMEHLDPGELSISRWGSLDDGTTFTRRVRPGQTLFGKRRAYQRKVAYAEFEAICSGDILTFEADDKRLFPELLPFLVQSNRFFDHALGTSAGSLSPRTNWRDLAAFQFDLPPLVEQQRIYELLWAMESHRLALTRLKRQLNVDESLDSVGRSLFESKAVEWPTVRFEDALKVSSGSFLPAKNMISGPVPVYGGNGVSGFHDTANFSDQIVMIGRVGAYCGAVHQTDGPSWVTDNALVVKHAAGYEQSFLASVLRHARLNQYASQTAQPAVSGVGLAKVQIARPTEEAQRAYLKQRESIESALRGVRDEAAALSRLRASMFVELFGGS